MRGIAFFLLLVFLAPHTASAYTVVIDPGHGSPDGGSQSLAGTPEKDYTLAVGKDLLLFLRFIGMRTVMTRSGDSGVYDPSASTIREKKVSDLENRLKMTLKIDAPVFLSIHMNASPIRSASGLQVFYAPSAGSEELGEALTAVFASSLKETRIRSLAPAPGGVFLMRKLTCPAVLLEYGYLSNPAENARLETDSYRQQLAFLTACGLLKYMIDEG
ncbi:MAG: N-acetylmuramoyl-L-alanine amidase [Clostridia bacterium]|nr:N-acetylmuramoyl-L-alanine amidase [Clostridia bacterium]